MCPDSVTAIFGAAFLARSLFARAARGGVLSNSARQAARGQLLLKSHRQGCFFLASARRASRLGPGRRSSFTAACSRRSRRVISSFRGSLGGHAPSSEAVLASYPARADGFSRRRRAKCSCRRPTAQVRLSTGGVDGAGVERQPRVMQAPAARSPHGHCGFAGGRPVHEEA